MSHSRCAGEPVILNPPACVEAPNPRMGKVCIRFPLFLSGERESLSHNLLSSPDAPACERVNPILIHEGHLLAEEVELQLVIVVGEQVVPTHMLSRPADV